MEVFPQALPLGTELGNFEIRAILGQGSSGFAYLCYDSLLEREVVLKEHFPQGLCHRRPDGEVEPSVGEEELFEQSLNLFLQEARTLAGLNHPGVVRILEVLPSHGTAVAIMEPARGETFAAYLSAHHDTAAVEQLLYRLLDILDFLHKHSIIHRDIKPANIIVQADGSPVLLDFGSALRGEPQGTRTIIGTPGFAAPEQFQTDGDIGPSSDCYALGMSFIRTLGAERVNALPRSMRLSLYRATRENASERFPDAKEWRRTLRPPLRLHRAASGLALFFSIAIGAVLFAQKSQEAPQASHQVQHAVREADIMTVSHALQQSVPLIGASQINSKAMESAPPANEEPPNNIAGLRLTFNPRQEQIGLIETEHTDWENMEEEQLIHMLKSSFFESPITPTRLLFHLHHLDFPDQHSWKVVKREGAAAYKHLDKTRYSLLTLSWDKGKSRFYLLRFSNDYSGTLATPNDEGTKILTHIPFTLFPTKDIAGDPIPFPETLKGHWMAFTSGDEGPSILRFEDGSHYSKGGKVAGTYHFERIAETMAKLELKPQQGKSIFLSLTFSDKNGGTVRRALHEPEQFELAPLGSAPMNVAFKNLFSPKEYGN